MLHLVSCIAGSAWLRPHNESRGSGFAGRSSLASHRKDAFASSLRIARAVARIATTSLDHGIRHPTASATRATSWAKARAGMPTPQAVCWIDSLRRPRCAGSAVGSRRSASRMPCRRPSARSRPARASVVVALRQTASRATTSRRASCRTWRASSVDHPDVRLNDGKCDPWRQLHRRHDAYQRAAGRAGDGRSVSAAAGRCGGACSPSGFGFDQRPLLQPRRPHALRGRQPRCARSGPTTTTPTARSDDKRVVRAHARARLRPRRRHGRRRRASSGPC